MFKRIFFVLPFVWIPLFSVAIVDDGNGCSQFSEFMVIDSKEVSASISCINNLKNLFENSKLFQNVKTRSLFSKSEKSEKPMDCAVIQEIDPDSKSGVHKIWPRGRDTDEPIDVYCDLEDDGGAGTVIQRRGDFNSGTDYFYKDWESYKLGFGDPEKDHWIGNDNIFALTNQRSNIVKFTLSDWEGRNNFAMYDVFWIEHESRNYTIHVSGYTGTAGDSFSYNNMMSFTTKDRDNDYYSDNCAVYAKGAWWYKECSYSNLNGMYLRGSQEFSNGVFWKHFRGFKYSLKDSVMKIRPKDFSKNSNSSPL